MLIKLDDSIIESENLNENIIDALDNIAISMREGNHIVISSKKVLNELLKIEELERKTLSTFNYIKKNRTIICSVEKYIEAYILVIKGNGEIVKELDDKGKCVFKVPIENMNELKQLNPAKLICEDESDYDFYRSICNKYIKEKNLGLKIELGEINGGGGKTAKNYEKHLTEYREKLLVIVDSDKKHKTDDIGNTAKEVEKKYIRYNQNYITDRYILKVREKENLITPKLYKLCSKSSNSKNDLNLLEYIENNTTLKSLYYYCDIKDGITYNELLNDSKNRELILSYLEERGKLNKITTIINALNRVGMGKVSNLLDELMSLQNKEAMKEISCTKIAAKTANVNQVKVTDKIGYLVDDFTNEILNDKLKEKIEYKIKCKMKNKELEMDIIKLQQNRKYSENLFEKLPNEIKEEWINISKKILTWGCCLKVKTS